MPIIGSSAGATKGAPGVPTIGTATAGDGSASVTFSAPSFSKLPITSYTVTASPGGATGTGASSPITVSGLSNGTAYTFTVRASHANGQSSASSASNSATPINPFTSFNASGTWTPNSYPASYSVYALSGGGGYGGQKYFQSPFQQDLILVGYGGGGAGGRYAEGSGVLNSGSLVVTVGTVGNNGTNQNGSGGAGAGNTGGASSAGSTSAAGGGGGAGGGNSSTGAGGAGGAGGSGGGGGGGFAQNTESGAITSLTNGGTGGSAGGAGGSGQTSIGSENPPGAGGSGSGVSQSSSGGTGGGGDGSPSYNGFTVDGTTFGSGKGLGGSQSPGRPATGGFVLIKRNS